MAMEPEPPVPPPSSCCSKPATAAVGHLQGVEKQLQNEGLAFNKETMDHLEDAIKAIKELEEERKHTIELLEEETIKNCNLRVRIKQYPEIVIKEFEELVAAAHRFHFHKLSEVEISVSKAVSAVESTYSRQELSEEENVVLCHEEAELWVKHQEIIELVNQQLSEKHAVNIEINQLHNMTREEREEIVRQESAIQELKTIMETEAIEFRERKTILDEQVSLQVEGVPVEEVDHQEAVVGAAVVGAFHQEVVVVEELGGEIPERMQVKGPQEHQVATFAGP
ncbi:uncharacterized protein LOC121927206 [Sceloporus undulatus]|uniref:uncharacterized protein LOC121927206 n=1 Tax=Sceloporus undulatus TaxID=8520 RepID=UPI001C4C5017|nr:uncharacterized protein LOC121927206 [Sceloporus undulatus]